MNGKDKFDKDKMYKVKLRIFYSWDYEVKGDRAPDLIKAFYEKNKPNNNKSVYHMTEEIKPKAELKNG